MAKSKDNLKGEIKALLKETNAVMLAHNYQRDEVQDAADVTGDSLALSQTAADSDAGVIVFCGVHFMAESAAILAPEKSVIMPRTDAGCPMADMITADQLREEKKKRPGAAVVAYVNTSAAVKAETDICCTSANAVKVVESVDSDRVYMVPDKNLAHYIQRSVKNKKMEWWDGFCPTHDDLIVEEVEKSKKEHPGALFVCHPECRPEVVDMADYVCSTSAMYEFARTSDATKFIMGTELGILWRLKKENPNKEFIIPSKSLICPNMKLTTLDDVARCLKGFKDGDRSKVVTVPEEIRVPAKEALDRMLAVPRD